MKFVTRTIHVVTADVGSKDVELSLFHKPVHDFDATVKVLPNNVIVVGYLSPDETTYGDSYWQYHDCESELIDVAAYRHKSGDINWRWHTVEELVGLLNSSQRQWVIVHKYEHSAVRYYREDDDVTERSIPDRDWDVSVGRYILLLPEDVDVDNVAKFADATLKEFSEYCNGEVYGVVVEGFYYDEETKTWDNYRDHSVWGHIGFDYAKTALAEAVAWMVKEEGPK